MRSERLRIPQDIGYASLNIADDVPKASGIEQHRGVMGELAVDILNSLLHGNQRGFNVVAHGTHIGGTWHEGTTVRPRPSANPST
ncbi:MAG: hypothetical protein ACREIA_16945 [Opitutaceae bacterium]